MEDEVSMSESSRSRSSSPRAETSDDEPERLIVRGRGRGRRRGGRTPRERGRGRGERGRGQRRAVVYGPAPPTRADIAQCLREEREEQLQERVSNLPLDRKNELLAACCRKDPGLIFQLLDEPAVPQQGHHPQPSSDTPGWCRCSNCREMPSDTERVCCGKVPANCVSRLQDFDLVVLDEVVLAVAQRYRMDVLAAGEDDDYNKGKRHAAYRQFILWTHGHLGAGNRRVIPSCCVWRIRDRFPDAFGQYRGFVSGRLE